jgi:hypothetical protein
MTAPQQPPHFPPSNSRPSTPERVAESVGMIVKTLVIVVGWSVLAIVALAAAYVALRAVFWVVSLALRALGAGS